MMMASENELFDQQIHDAFDRVELSEEASERILANLLAAQGQTREDAPAEESARDSKQQAEVIRLLSRRKGLPRWLPVAAVLLVALVVVQVAIRGSERVSDANQMVVMQKDEGVAEVMSTEAEEADSMEAMPVTEGAVADYDASSLVERYSVITLPDGTSLTTFEEGVYPREVDETAVGASLGEAVATAPDTGEQLSCEVFELVDDLGAYAVRYEGETSYWRCTKQ